MELPKTPLKANLMRILVAQFDKALRKKENYIKFAMDEKDVRIWYVKLHNIPGNKEEFAGGEYIIRVIAPDNFPVGPPDFMAMTPNGVYAISGNLCVSIGKYHKDEYTPTMGMVGFIMNVISGLICYKDLRGGIGMEVTTDEEKKKLARESIEYNRTKLKEINNLIEDSQLRHALENLDIDKQKSKKNNRKKREPVEDDPPVTEVIEKTDNKEDIKKVNDNKEVIETLTEDAND